jgi:hypothetical protein
MVEIKLKNGSLLLITPTKGKIKMKDKGILECQKEGQFVYYKLVIKEISSLLDCMENCKVKK